MKNAHVDDWTTELAIIASNVFLFQTYPRITDIRVFDEDIVGFLKPEYFWFIIGA